MQMKELNEEYRRTTDNMLGAVRIQTGWDESVVPVYESSVPHISVPGSLEFMGLYSPVAKLLQKGLKVYVDGFDGKVIDDLFTGLTESERLDLLRSCDPVLLGFAAETLRYYHPGRMCLEGTSSSWEYNGIMKAQINTTTYKNNPLSQELTDEITGFHPAEISRDLGLEKKQKIESRILAELSEKVKQGFQIGRR